MKAARISKKLELKKETITDLGNTKAGLNYLIRDEFDSEPCTNPTTNHTGCRICPEY